MLQIARLMRLISRRRADFQSSFSAFRRRRLFCASDFCAQAF